jgi:hypothetical protein
MRGGCQTYGCDPTVHIFSCLVITYWQVRIINALERRERAAHRGDSDIVLSRVYPRDRQCMSMFDLYYVAIADGEGWTRRPRA